MAELKIFLGYAPGVGKTYTMLNEGNRRLKRGENVLIGYLEHHNRKDTIEQVQNLSSIPLKEISYKGKVFHEMDLDAIISMKPQLVLVDELAHTNIKGSRNEKRYMDVLELLENDINVYTTLNLQHLESLNDIVYNITRIKVNETIPDNIIEKAKVVVIDINPDALINRVKRGDIYKSNLIHSSLKNFFRKGNLSALRELTLRQLADEVDDELEKYKFEHNLNENWQTVERIMVSISGSPSSKKLIRMGARVAKKYKCEFYCVYVDCTHSLSPNDSPENLKALEENIALAKSLDAQVFTLKGRSVSQELIDFVAKKHITKLLLGHSRRTSFQKFFRGSTINKVLEAVKNVEVIIIPYN